ncbi:MAG: DUF3429 domain-containing protein [Pseudomonadota bacterium]
MSTTRFSHDVHDPVAKGDLRPAGTDEAQNAGGHDAPSTSRLGGPYANDRYDQPGGGDKPAGSRSTPDRSGADYPLTRLGYLGLIPFGFGAGIAWLSPWLVSPAIALTIAMGTIAYGGIIAAYMAGMGAGGLLTQNKPGIMTYLSGMIATLIAWLMIIPDGYFFLSIAPVWRVVGLIIVFAYLYARDLQLAVAGTWPDWYTRLRFRLTAWVFIALTALGARLLFWALI